MGHNKDRRPTYPAENKKGKGKSIVKLLKDGWAYAFLVIIFLLFINAIVIIHDNHIRRNQIKDNPVETEAVITKIGRKGFLRGRHYAHTKPVYYDYYVGDSLYHGKIYESTKERETNNMRVGNTIKITYERDNPSNSMFGETVSQY